MHSSEISEITALIVACTGFGTMLTTLLGVLWVIRRKSEGERVGAASSAVDKAAERAVIPVGPIDFPAALRDLAQEQRKRNGGSGDGARGDPAAGDR